MELLQVTLFYNSFFSIDFHDFVKFKIIATPHIQDGPEPYFLYTKYDRYKIRAGSFYLHSESKISKYVKNV